MSWPWKNEGARLRGRVGRAHRGLLCLALALAVGIAGCRADGEPARQAAGPAEASDREPPRLIDPPAAPDSLAPNLALVEGGPALTWLEPVGAGHRLRFAVLRGGEWSEPVTIVEGERFFANWADLPGVVATAGGELIAHWLEKTAPDTYAYSIMLARSADGGTTWSRAGKLNSDATHTEHGFVSWIAEGDGVRAFWLDGRAMEDEGGTMAVRTAHVGERVEPEEVLDERTCECCSTSAARVGGEPAVVYRDRSEGEVRDIAFVRRGGDGWAPPAPVHDDGWEIAGCPVNGPEIAARGERAWVAWFTAAGSQATVKLAVSDDGGGSFGEPLALDDEEPVGRVDLALDSEGTAWVSWIGTTPNGGVLRLARRDAGGALETFVVAPIETSRAAGVPRLVLADGSWFVTWVDAGAEGGRQLRLATGRLSAI